MLKNIIKNKIKEVEMSKKNLPLHSFRNKLKSSERDFKMAISKDKLSLIAEFKRSSPSQHFISRKNALAFSAKSFFETIKIYNKYADAISILTDKKFFDGSLGNMKTASQLTSLPILRKDFIIDKYQIYESRLYNADAVLLIAELLSKNELSSLIDAAKEYKMDCLVEVHTEDDLTKALDSGAEIIGINNRDLNTLNVDTGATLRLVDKIPEGKIIVSESGICSNEYINKIKRKANAILVGSFFMNSKNLEKDIISLSKWQK